MLMMSSRPRISHTGTASKEPSSVHNAAVSSPRPLSTDGPYCATSCMISTWSSSARTWPASRSTVARSSSISVTCLPPGSRHHDDPGRAVRVAGGVERGRHRLQPDARPHHRSHVEAAGADCLERLEPVLGQRAAAELDVEALALSGQGVQVVALGSAAERHDAGAALASHDDRVEHAGDADALEHDAAR